MRHKYIIHKHCKTRRQCIPATAHCLVYEIQMQELKAFLKCFILRLLHYAENCLKGQRYRQRSINGIYKLGCKLFSIFFKYSINSVYKYMLEYKTL